MLEGGDNTVHQSDERSPPTFADIAQALKVLKEPDPNQASAIAKHVPTILVAGVIGLMMWVMTSVNALQQSVTQAVTTIQSIQKDVGAMSQRTDRADSDQSDLRTSVARLEQRVETLEGRGTLNAPRDETLYRSQENSRESNPSGRF